MAYKASGASYASTLASIYHTFGNSRHKGSSSGRRSDTGMHGDPRLTTNGLAAAGHTFHVRLSARLTFPRSTRLVVGTSSTKPRRGGKAGLRNSPVRVRG